ncbi:MAG: hypothetical protein ABR564_04430 [Candidatus Dormibacteria bacterium]
MTNPPPPAPPSERLITALVVAGISRSTAMAMETGKAEEVLLLLGSRGAGTVSSARRVARLSRHPARRP